MLGKPPPIPSHLLKKNMPQPEVKTQDTQLISKKTPETKEKDPNELVKESNELLKESQGLAQKILEELRETEDDKSYSLKVIKGGYKVLLVLQSKALSLQSELLKNHKDFIVSTQGLAISQNMNGISAKVLETGKLLIELQTGYTVKNFGVKEMISRFFPESTNEEKNNMYDVFIGDSMKHLEQKSLEDEYERAIEAVKLFRKFRNNINYILSHMNFDPHAEDLGKDTFVGRLADMSYKFTAGKYFKKIIKSGMSEQEMFFLECLTKPEIGIVKTDKKQNKYVYEKKQVENRVLKDHGGIEAFPLLSDETYDKLVSGKITSSETQSILKELSYVVKGLDLRMQYLVDNEAEARLTLNSFMSNKK